MKSVSASSSSFHEVSGRGVWRFRTRGPRFWEVEREHDVPGVVETMDTTGKYWILGFAEVRKGTVTYETKSGPIRFSRGHYGFFFPKNSLTLGKLARSRQKIRCVISSGEPPKGAPDQAVVFKLDSHAFPISWGAAGRLLSLCELTHVIEYNAHPSGSGAKIKGLLDRCYDSSISIGEIARKLKSNPSTIGRVFRREFGVTPLKYCNHLRLTDSSFSLFEGQPVSRVFLDVGFEDLSRFNKQFKRLTGVSPRKFKPRSKNAKS